MFPGLGTANHTCRPFPYPSLIWPHAWCSRALVLSRLPLEFVRVSGEHERGPSKHSRSSVLSGMARGLVEGPGRVVHPCCGPFVSQAEPCDPSWPRSQTEQPHEARTACAGQLRLDSPNASMSLPGCVRARRCARSRRSSGIAWSAASGRRRR